MMMFAVKTARYLLLFLAIASFLEASSLMGSTGVNVLIKASDYSFFLNAIAVKDEGFFYNNAMRFDAHAGGIARVGAPGSYRYFVIAGREKFPAAYLNEASACSYGNWLRGEFQANSPFSIRDEDAYLASNQSLFYLPEQESSLVLGFSQSLMTNNTWRDVEIGGGILLGILAAREGIRRCHQCDAKDKEVGVPQKLEHDPLPEPASIEDVAKNDVLRDARLPGAIEVDSKNGWKIPYVQEALDSVNNTYDDQRKSEKLSLKGNSYLVGLQTYAQYKGVVEVAEKAINSRIMDCENALSNINNEIGNEAVHGGNNMGKFFKYTQKLEMLRSPEIRAGFIKEIVDYFIFLAKQSPSQDVQAVIEAIEKSGKLYHPDPLIENKTVFNKGKSKSNKLVASKNKKVLFS